MVLARAWRRRLFGALGAATLAPGMLIGALAVVALAGGFASLGALSQAFSGPAVPAAQRFSPNLLQGLKVALPASTAGALGAATSSGLGAQGGAAAAGSTTGGGGTGANGLGGGGQGGSGGGGQGGSGGGGQGGSGGGQPTTGSPAGSPSPFPNPTAVDQVSGAAASATSQLPAPLGPLVTKQVSSASSAADQILSGGSHPTRTRVTRAAGSAAASS